MKVCCTHCQQINEIDDADVRQYINSLNGKTKSTTKAEACRANASKPRPGAQGKKKPRKPKGPAE